MSLDWQSIHHLLLCWLDEVSGVQILTTLSPLLQQALPHTEITLLVANADIQINEVQAINCQSWSDHSRILELISRKTFDAAILLTAPTQSPYSIAYLCYLAKIPIRIGQSQEFGGGVLSHCVSPGLDPVEPIAYHLHLFRSSGIFIPQQSPQTLTSKISYAVTNFNLARSR